MILNSIFKRKDVFGAFKHLLSAWVDLIFPPLCVCCKEACQTQLLCQDCWDLCSPPDPDHRCHHCFVELYESGLDYLCRQCQKEPLLSVPYASVFESTEPAYRLCREKKESPEAIAGFMMHQWVRLNWPVPNFVIPTTDMALLARTFAFWLSVPSISILSFIHNEWQCRTDKVEEDQIFLILDFNSSFFQLQKMVEALSEAFPKRVYVLSLIHHDISSDS